jgi:hypothetical protein
MEQQQYALSEATRWNLSVILDTDASTILWRIRVGEWELEHIPFKMSSKM